MLDEIQILTAIAVKRVFFYNSSTVQVATTTRHTRPFTRVNEYFLVQDAWNKWVLLASTVPCIDVAIALPNLSDVTTLIVSTSNLCLHYIRPENKSRPPISRLSPELLQEIFLLTLLSPTPRLLSSPYTPVVSPNTLVSPFPLSDVNRQWRTIVNGTPAIWRSIAIISPHHRLLYRTELWLERARNYSLDIFIKQTDDKVERDATLKVLDMLIVHKPRWRSINFDFPLGIPGIITTALMDMQRLPKSSLQDARISYGEEPDDIAERPSRHKMDAIYKALQSIPSVRKLTWHAPFITPHVRFGSHLQFLELDSPICIRELADNVGRCPSLIYLSAQQIRVSTFVDRRTSPIRLPNLVVLILTITVPEETDDEQELSFIPFLERFSAPRLAQLQLKNVMDHPDVTDDAANNEPTPKPHTRTAVQELLQRSKCHLKSLNVHIRDASAAEVQAWMNIDGVEDVEMLCISGAEINDTVLEMLTREHEHVSAAGNLLEGRRFPNLKQLGLSLCEESVDEDVLLRMLGSRFWTPVVVSVLPPYFVGDTSFDSSSPRKAMSELCAAHIWVRDYTANMMRYEKMINTCAERIGEWQREGRELKFTLGR